MELHLVADTNLFLECLPLHDLPWSDLQADPVIVILTKPVLDELDKHKRSTGRTRDRALKILKFVRDMHGGIRHEVDIQSASPRVILRLVANSGPRPDLTSVLDYSRADDRLVGIAATLASDLAHSPKMAQVVLFTDDTGPAIVAQSHGLGARLIPEHWKRSAPESMEQKEVRELTKELARYRSLEPTIKVRLVEPSPDRGVVTIVRRVASPLNDAQLETIMAALQRKHPLVVAFDPPAASRVTSLTGDLEVTEFSPPTPDQIGEYRDKSYAEWLRQCRSILSALHESYISDETVVRLVWEAENIGSRPAAMVRIEFATTGCIRLARPARDAASKSRPLAELPKSIESRLPSPPKPPPFARKVTRTRRPTDDAERARLLGIGFSKLELDTLKYAGTGGIHETLRHARN